MICQLSVLYLPAEVGVAKDEPNDNFVWLKGTTHESGGFLFVAAIHINAVSDDMDDDLDNAVNLAVCIIDQHWMENALA